MIDGEKRCARCGDRLRPDLWEIKYCTNCARLTGDNTVEF